MSKPLSNTKVLDYQGETAVIINGWKCHKSLILYKNI